MLSRKLYLPLQHATVSITNPSSRRSFAQTVSAAYCWNRHKRKLTRSHVSASRFSTDTTTDSSMQNNADVDFSAIFCDPHTKEPLKAKAKRLVNERTGTSYQVDTEFNIVHFLQPPPSPQLNSTTPATAIQDDNKKYQKLYDRIARIYDIAETAGAFILFGGRGAARRIREEFLSGLEIPTPVPVPSSSSSSSSSINTNSITNTPRPKVLEVSIGTGINLQYLPPSTTTTTTANNSGDVIMVGPEYYGLDISLGMLQQCRRNTRTKPLYDPASHKYYDVHLCHGEAENLPFRSDSFDVVYHIGGINFFNDKHKAIREMLRVAKPGTKLMIIDETEHHSTSAYEKFPLIGRFFRNRKEVITAPLDYIRSLEQQATATATATATASASSQQQQQQLDMVEPGSITYEEIWNRRMYKIQFRKAGAKNIDNNHANNKQLQ